MHAHDFEKSDLRLDLVSLSDTSWGDVIEVLKPFEVRASDTTSVDKHIWGTDNSLGLEDLFGLEGCWTISSFENSSDLDFVGVASVERFLNGSWNHTVSLFQKESVWIRSCVLSGLRVASERSVFGQVLFDILYIKTVWVVDGRVVLDDGGNLSSVLLNELGSPVSDSSESLNDEGLILDSKTKVDLIDK